MTSSNTYSDFYGTPAERVARGVALLDQHGPANWRTRINPATLDIQSPLNCVLGQIYGRYEVGLRNLTRSSGAGFVSSLQHGFNSLSDGDDIAVTEAWRNVLTDVTSYRRRRFGFWPFGRR